MKRAALLFAMLACLIVICGNTSSVQADEALAFATEVKGFVVIQRAGGTQDTATVGSQLFSGDEIKATEGTAVLVYLSGRSVTVKAGTSHKAQKADAGASKRMERLMGTLGEMIGARAETERPVVHGMARSLPLTGSAPANTKISTTNFAFSWDGLEGAESYTFSLTSEDGKELASRSVQDTVLGADTLDLTAGRTYVWTVTAEFIIPHSTGKNHLEIASREEAAALADAFKEIEETHTGTTQTLLRAAACYNAGYLFEAQDILSSLKGKEDLASVNKMLRLLQAKMQAKGN